MTHVVQVDTNTGAIRKRDHETTEPGDRTITQKSTQGHLRQIVKLQSNSVDHGVDVYLQFVSQSHPIEACITTGRPNEIDRGRNLPEETEPVNRHETCTENISDVLGCDKRIQQGLLKLGICRDLGSLRMIVALARCTISRRPIRPRCGSSVLEPTPYRKRSNRLTDPVYHVHLMCTDVEWILLE